MQRRYDLPRGRLESLTVHDRALADNLLADPGHREVAVYLPAGHDGDGLPLLVYLAGFTGSGLGAIGWKGFEETVPERLDRLIGDKAMPPVAVAFPDCFTRLGGNQYIDSAAMGGWAKFLTGSLLSAVEGRFGCGGAGRRGIFGKSSGGFGAMVHAMKYPDIWSAAACHSGDMAFELCYLKDMPAALRALSKHSLDVGKWLAAFEDNPKPSGGDIHVLMTLAMAATYDPDPDSPMGIRLPVDLETCTLIEDRWANWLAWDPCRIVDDHRDALAGMKALFFDCGTVDQYDLVYGARRLHRRMTALDIPHRYEEFPDTHSGISYRMDISLPYMASRLV